MSIMKILWHFVMKLKPKKYPSHEASIVLRFHLWCQKYCNSTSWHFFVFLRSSRYKKSFLFSLLLLASWFYKILLQIYENFGCSSLFSSFLISWSGLTTKKESSRRAYSCFSNHSIFLFCCNHECDLCESHAITTLHNVSLASIYRLLQGCMIVSTNWSKSIYLFALLRAPVQK